MPVFRESPAVLPPIAASNGCTNARVADETREMVIFAARRYRKRAAFIRGPDQTMMPPRS